MKSFVTLSMIFVLAESSANAQAVPQGNSLLKPDKAAILPLAKFPEDCLGNLNLTGVQVFIETEVKSTRGVPFTLTTVRFKYGNQVCLTSSLTDLISKIPAIVATVNLPKNDCASYVMPNPVIDIYNSQLAPSADSEGLIFTMNGKMTPWACAPGPQIPHGEWVKPKWGIPYYRVWFTKGPDIKTVGDVKPFNEYIPYKFKTVGTVDAGPKEQDGADIPNFSLQIPNIDMSSIIIGALGAAKPNFNSPTSPLIHVEGARYNNNLSQVWGTY